MFNTRQNNATDGRVYGGDCGLIHIQDGGRAAMGERLANDLDMHMRNDAVRNGLRSLEQASEQDLCAGCYMVAIFNAAVTLAQRNGQTLTELGNSMSEAFAKLARDAAMGEINIEHINVVLDPEEDEQAELTARDHENAALAFIIRSGVAVSWHI